MLKKKKKKKEKKSEFESCLLAYTNNKQSKKQSKSKQNKKPSDTNQNGAYRLWLSVSRRKTQWTWLGLKSLVLYKVQATVRCQKKPTVFLSIDGQRLTKPILNNNTYIQAHVIHILATSFIWIVYCFLSAYICFLFFFLI